jgi:hypothetical protein
VSDGQPRDRDMHAREKIVVSRRGWAVFALVCLGPALGCGTSAPRPLANGDYRLALDSLEFQVAAAGARVVDVHLPGGANLLTGAAVNTTNFGSTFWTSPQSAWGWPPPPEFDTAAFKVGGDDASLVFTGPPGTEVQAALGKTFTAAGMATVRIDYRITAAGADGRFAPWEITRVFPGGLTFFPTGADQPRAGGGFALPPVQTAAGCTWYQHPGTPPGADQKLLADGAGGWLAQVSGNVLLVKQFADVPYGQAAPGEAEIEIFAHGQGDYVEIEEQGAYQALPKGQTLTWPVTWIVRQLPDGLDATAGSPDLVALVQSLVSP